MEINQPLFSIITVVYNGASCLERTIRSVASQDFDSVEYIIQDGGSTDGTIEIIKKHDDSITYWNSEKDTGVYDGMNKAVKNARGRWILFLNAGDFFVSSDVLKKIFLQLQGKMHYDLIYGDVVLNNIKQTLIKARKFEIIKYFMPFCHQSVFVSKEIFSLLNFNTNYTLGADYDFFYRLNKLQQPSYLKLDFPFAIFDVGGISHTRNVFKEYYEISKYHNGNFHWVSVYHFFRFKYRTMRSSVVRFLRMYFLKTKS